MMKKIWKSYQIAVWVTIALIVLPLIGLAFALPKYIASLNLDQYVK